MGLAASAAAPSETAQNFVEWRQRADARSEVTRSDEHFANIVVKLQQIEVETTAIAMLQHLLLLADGIGRRVLVGGSGRKAEQVNCRK